jgi:8-hydroxy-5-deazaflavin:NADPH oxidoreductase
VKIAILGTGVVGRTLAAGLAAAGHDVVIGTRDPEATLARAEPDQMGTPPYRDWQEQHADVTLRAYAEAAAHGEVVVNATAGEGALSVIGLAGPQRLAGRVLVDVSNPLDFSAGFPPTLAIKDTDSLAEAIQRAVPEAKVVKTLNTVTAAVMVDPGSVAGGDHTVFLSGDDAEAKATVAGLLEQLGWRDIVDLGDLSTARGQEMFVPLWLRLMRALGTPQFGVKVVR